MCIRDRYLPALAAGIIGDTVLNLWVNHYVDCKYPFLVKMKKEKPKQELVSKLFNDLKNVFVSKLCMNLLNGTDNLIISGFINICLLYTSVLRDELNDFRVTVQKIYTDMKEEEPDQTDSEEMLIDYMNRILCQKVFTEN